MKRSRQILLHDAFRVGIALKAADGLLEIVGGVLVWLLTPSTATRIVHLLFRHELAEDPRDFVATRLLGASRTLARRKAFASAFLLSHGLAKVVLVVALWFNRLWAYPLMIAVLVGFVFYQVLRLAQGFSLMLAFLTLFDVLVIWLTWHEYREQKRLRATRVDGDGRLR